MKLPKAIYPCPILDALVEIRFSTKIHPSAVFGMIFNVLKGDFPNVENLPILQLPEAVRATDPNFKFKPHYRISNEKFVIQIGPNVLTISSFPKYTGWKEFSEQIFRVLNNVEKVGIIDSVIRIGIRYINFFDNNIFKDIELKICIRNKDIEYKNTIVRTEIEQGDYKSSLQVANNANYKNKLGSIIDIDTFTESNLKDFFANKEEVISRGHAKEKELFYSLLNENFLKTLNPTY
ncbi:TIGR04255 family protein [Thermophagus xiamenensis]|uniref:TIGR04255 family protein n=1 Tax=Thermophagus xiamenensis TaxID=385682 RepID=A0A1I1VYM2_9BACT|nr:TIGR04255 family protein [Thermophagus xiamenensis]SFD87158.1 TIGR04255 family protein [Thermophagus xiamenensis]